MDKFLGYCIREIECSKPWSMRVLVEGGKEPCICGSE